MPGYGDLPTIKQMLNITGAGQDTRLEQLNTAMSALLDDALGRSFLASGDSATPETRTVYQDAALDAIALPVPLVSVTGIEIGGSWDGSAWTDATTLASDSYRLRDGGWWIDLYGSTASAYRITGVWGDTATEEAPPLVVEAVNVMVTRAYKRDEAGAGGELIGPTEFEVRAPQGILTDDRVKRAIEAYRLVEHVL